MHQLHAKFLIFKVEIYLKGAAGFYFILNSILLSLRRDFLESNYVAVSYLKKLVKDIVEAAFLKLLLRCRRNRFAAGYFMTGLFFV